jgi:RimJ/RimL family protein N-acetyltransferase
MASLARRCVEEGLGRMEWAVLDWNAPAIAVYDRVGSAAMGGWTVRRLTGESLRALAAG